MSTNRNHIAATLALLAMLGFLVIFAVLGFVKVPQENRDFFNTGFIALIGFVATAFGYYLGSSQGSAMKNALLAQPPLMLSGPPSPTGPISPTGPKGSESPEAGFIHPRLLLAMAALAIGVLFGIAFGCSTTAKKETPEALTAKSLLSARQAIIAAGSAADALCAKGVIGKAECKQVATVYGQAQAAYASAADAYLLYLTYSDDVHRSRFEDTQPKLLALTTDLKDLVSKFGGGGK